MRFSFREDTALPADQLFAALSDFARIERMMARGGADVRRVDPAQQPGVGMAWDIAFDLQGKQRALRLTITRFDPPEEIVIHGQGDAVDLEVTVTVIALTRAKSRMMLDVEAKARNMRARLMLQTARLGKAQLDRRLAQRVSAFLDDLAAKRG